MITPDKVNSVDDKSWGPHVIAHSENNALLLWSCCGGSVAQLCLTLCDPVACSTPGFPVLHHILGLAQTQVH